MAGPSSSSLGANNNNSNLADIAADDLADVMTV
jgi:hypothetical protein